MTKRWIVVMVMMVLCLVCGLAACGEKAQCVVKFDPNYVGGEATTRTVDEGATVSLDAISRSGYVFDGWYKDPACLEAADADAKIKVDVTYYAKWVVDGTAASTPSDTPSDVPSGETAQGSGDSSAGNAPSGGSDQTQPSQDTPSDEPRTLMAIRATYSGSVAKGAPFDTTAITVTATYNVGDPRVVTGYTLDSDYAATNDTHTVGVNYREDGVSCHCDMTYQFATQQYTARTIDTLYFTNNKGWSTVYAYMWDGTDSAPVKNHAWPGVECTPVETNSFGEKVYSYHFDAKAGYRSVIFNNGGSEQTHDIALQAGLDAYYPKDKAYGRYNVGAYVRGADVSVHVFENLGSWAVDGCKKVYVYTPAGYDATKQYKVLYMLDGQNLFDSCEVAGRMGSWGVDATLHAAGLDAIVVGIANDESEAARNNQLTMHQRFGELSAMLDMIEPDKKGTFMNGTLDELGDFIKNVLRPFVNQNYSTKTGREDTLIAGSSSGGLAAFYLAMRDADVYGTVGAFSPATGIFTLSAWQQYLASDAQAAMRRLPQSAFIYCGYGAGSDDLENVLYAYDTSAGASTLQGLLASAGYQTLGDVCTSMVQGKCHNEAAWREAFATFVAFVCKH